MLGILRAVKPKPTLKQLRELTGHSATWCAANIGGVALRSWQYWEAGTQKGYPSKAPDDVMENMQKLADAVQAVVQQANPPLD